MADRTPQREVIRACLERLLVWPEMARSPQLARFLDYIVQRTLDGDEAAIKAYSIAVDVLGRSADFDPQVDPIVRVQARRLRNLLDEYYAGPGADDPLRIVLPVGRYVPEFIVASPPREGTSAVAVSAPLHAPVPTRRARAAGGVNLSWFVLLVLAVGLGTAGLAALTFRPVSPEPARAGVMLQQPSVSVVEFQNLVERGEDGAKVSGLAIELVTDLDQFGAIDARYGGGGSRTLAAREEFSDFVLTGIVRRDRALVQYSAILTDSRSGAVVWNHSVAVPAPAATEPSVLDEVSRRLSLVLGSPRGPLHRPARTLLAQAPAAGGPANRYLCSVLFDLYREAASAQAAAQTHACLGELPAEDRAAPSSLAIAASLLAEQGLPPEAGDTLAERRRLAAAGLAHAVSLAPLSAFVWEQHARLHEEMGRFDEARTDYSSAIQLNPASGDALAGYARLLVFSGEADAAEALARDAVDYTPSPPDWYFGAPTVLALRESDNAVAIDNALRYAPADPELGPILAILAGQRGRDYAVVDRYLAQVLDVASFRTKGVLPRLRERVRDEALISQISDALSAAGVPEAALRGPF